MQERWSELGDFLRTRRAQLPAPDWSLGARRQVDGLRREELAERAGVSATYLTRLEQGRAPNVSDDVLLALCRALGLDEAERAHVWRLARPAPGGATEPTGAGPAAQVGDGSPERVRPAIATLIATLAWTPALVLGRDRHLLAWNPAAHALHAPHLPFALLDTPATRPWWPALLFCDPQVAERFVDWEDKARDTAADLRAALAGRPGGDRLHGLVAGLHATSTAFAALWDAYPVSTCAFHDRRYRAPDGHEFILHDEFLELSDDDGQRLAIFSAPDGAAPDLALLAWSGGVRL